MGHIYCARIYTLCMWSRCVPFFLVVGPCSPLGSAWSRTRYADMENECGEERHILCFGGPLRKAETYTGEGVGGC